MKIYFTKLGKGLLNIGFVLLLTMLLMNFMITIVNIIIPESLALLRSICYLALPVFALSLFTCKRRLNQSEKRRQYLDELSDSPFRFSAETVKVLKSADFLAELAVFVTFLVLLTIASWGGNILSTIIHSLIYILFFVIIDAGIWLLVHSNWAKERIRKG